MDSSLSTAVSNYINDLSQALKSLKPITLQMTQSYFIFVSQLVDLINMLTLI